MPEKNRLDCSLALLLVITIIERFPRHPSLEQFVGKTRCRPGFGPRALKRAHTAAALAAEIVVNLY